MRSSWIKFKFNNVKTNFLYITYSQITKLSDFQIENQLMFALREQWVEFYMIFVVWQSWKSECINLDKSTSLYLLKINFLFHWCFFYHFSIFILLTSALIFIIYIPLLLLELHFIDLDMFLLSFNSSNIFISFLSSSVAYSFLSRLLFNLHSFVYFLWFLLLLSSTFIQQGSDWIQDVT